MRGILAIETSTEACSVAVSGGERIRSCHEIAPQQHSVLVFNMLRGLFGSDSLRSHGVEAIAYGCGPGSFTGLRIAASAVQGLAYACGLPAIAVSSLAVLAQSALRRGVVDEGQTVLCTFDARINEIYAAFYTFQDGLANQVAGPWVCAPGDLPPAPAGSLVGVGSGCRFAGGFAADLRSRLASVHPDVLPEAEDMLALAQAKLVLGEVLTASMVQPLYVRDEVTWKKIPEQGRRH